MTESVSEEAASRPERAGALGAVADAIDAARPGHPLRVGIDGVCGAGKSTFARALVERLLAMGIVAVHVDSDGFHHPRERRYRQGRDSARGYYEDAYDFERLVAEVLRPLGPGGSRRFATRVHELGSDRLVTNEYEVLPERSVAVFDATFIQRPELDGMWDLVVFLDTSEDAALARGIARDAAALGGVEAAALAYERRYLAACRIYLQERDPRARASFVIDNTDPASPVLTRSPEPLPTVEFMFPGQERDRIVAAIRSGAKTSTSSLLRGYEVAAEALPSVGDRGDVLDSDGARILTIETTAVEVVPLRDVPLEHALAEGEGYRSVADWRRAHLRFWTSDAMRAELGRDFEVDDETLVVLERFVVVE